MTQDEKYLIKQFKPVTIQDDMMFGTVMADPNYCKPFLETILGMKIDRIEYPERQKVIDLQPRSRRSVYTGAGKESGLREQR